ncbi:MAG TPA: hypothetical protein VHO48_11050, partial [Anaerolineaceae bacterium]|nr:hypothetical protein [Anaerolineaceae bacterium]
YWVDVTDLAQRYGWERLPALSNWRTYYAGTRYNTFIKTDGKDWQTAMLDLYPPEALVSPTAVVPPTSTPTRAPAWYKSPTPGSTAEPSVTPTPRPTWTPLPPAGQ